MTELGKKGFDYFNNQVNKGNVDILSMIGELLTENEGLKATVSKMETTTEKNSEMKTVRFKVNKRIFLDLIGLNDFKGNFYIGDETLDYFEVNAHGKDVRLPDSEEYPEYKLTLTRVRDEARFVKVQ